MVFLINVVLIIVIKIFIVCKYKYMLKDICTKIWVYRKSPQIDTFRTITVKS